MARNSGYEAYPGIDRAPFDLPTGGPALTSDTYAAALAGIRDHVAATEPRFLGYQANQDLDFSHLADLLDVQLNNLGGPFTNGDFRLNVKWVERAVLDYFGWLWHAPAPWSEAEDGRYWGYVLSMGSTEGNMYGLWNAREYLSGESVLADDLRGAEVLRQTPPTVPASPNEFSPVAVYSTDIHYSISKALRALKIPTVGQVAAELGIDPEGELLAGMPCYPESEGVNRSGSIDLERLEQVARGLIEAGHPLVVVLNYGTAFRGAYDDVAAAVALVNRIVTDTYGDLHRTVHRDGELEDRRTRVWYHVDGALGAAFAPYLQGTEVHLPAFDFRTGISSISTSGHKWMGAPWPCGIFMTLRDNQLRPTDVPIIGGADTTFAGSRNGLSAVLMWSYLARTGVEANVAKARRLQQLADRAEATLRALDDEMQRDHGIGLGVARSENALTIRFRRLSDALVARYSLASDRAELLIDGRRDLVDASHIFIMDHVQESLVDQLVTDIRAAGPGAVPPRSTVPVPVRSSGAGHAFGNVGGGFQE